MKRFLLLIMIIAIALVASPALMFAASCGSEGTEPSPPTPWAFPYFGIWDMVSMWITFDVDGIVDGGEIPEEILAHHLSQVEINEDGYSSWRIDLYFNSSGHADHDNAGYGSYWDITNADPGAAFNLTPHENGTVTVGNPDIDQEMIDFIMEFFGLTPVTVSSIENFTMMWYKNETVTLDGAFDIISGGSSVTNVAFTADFVSPRPVPDWDGLYNYNGDPPEENEGWWHLWMWDSFFMEWVPTGILYHFSPMSELDGYTNGNFLQYAYSDWDFDGEVEFDEIFQILEISVLYEWGTSGELYVWPWDRIYEYETTGSGLYFESLIDFVLWKPWDYDGHYPSLTITTSDMETLGTVAPNASANTFSGQ